MRTRGWGGTFSLQFVPQMSGEGGVHRADQVGTVISGQVFCNLLIHLTLEDLFSLPAVQVSRFALRAAQRLEHLLVECAGDKVLEGLADIRLLIDLRLCG